MSGIRKLKAVRAIVRPDRRVEYIAGWRRYAKLAVSAGARVWLWEDQVLPGRFLELSEHEAAEGMEALLESAYRESELRKHCVRREGDEVVYRVTDQGFE